MKKYYIIFLGVLVVGSMFFFLRQREPLSFLDNAYNKLFSAVGFESNPPLLLVVLENGLQLKIGKELKQYVADVKKELQWNVEMIEVSPTAKVPEVQQKIFSIQKNRPLKGVLLVGNIPAPHVYNSAVTDPIFLSEGDPLADYVYQDIYKKCIYNVAKDKYSSEDPECRNDLVVQPYWVSRITPNSTKVDSVTLLKDYFVRNHQFRIGKKTYNDSVLVYAPILLDKSEQERTESKEEFIEQARFGNLFDGKVNIIDVENSVSDDQYALALNNSLGNSILFYNGHGNPTFHQKNFSTEPDAVDPNLDPNYSGNKGVLDFEKPTPFHRVGSPNVFMSILASCSVGRFTTPDYIAGEYLFSRGLVALTSSVPVFAVYDFKRAFFSTLLSGVPVSDAITSLPTGGSNLMGDPTLRLPKQSSHARTNLKLSANAIALTKEKEFSMKIKNTGKNNLYLDFVLLPNKQKNFSLLGVTPYETDGVFQSEKNSPYHLLPGTEGTITFKNNISIGKDGKTISRIPEGFFTGTFFIISNDAKNPFMKVPVRYDYR